MRLRPGRTTVRIVLVLRCQKKRVRACLLFAAVYPPPRKHTHPCVRACACVRVCVRACGAQPALSSSHAARLRQQHEAEDRRRHEARRVLQSLLQRYAHRRRFRVEKEEEARRSRAREEEEARRICWEAEQQRLRIEAQDEAKRLRLASIKLALKVKQRGSCLRKRIRV